MPAELLTPAQPCQVLPSRLCHHLKHQRAGGNEKPWDTLAFLTHMRQRLFVPAAPVVMCTLQFSEVSAGHSGCQKACFTDVSAPPKNVCQYALIFPEYKATNSQRKDKWQLPETGFTIRKAELERLEPSWLGLIQTNLPGICPEYEGQAQECQCCKRQERQRLGQETTQPKAHWEEWV